MANSTIKSLLKYEDLTCTVGSNSYYGFYYGDLPITKRNNVAFVVLNATSNHPAMVQLMDDTNLRFNAGKANTTITVRRWYI